MARSICSSRGDAEENQLAMLTVMSFYAIRDSSDCAGLKGYRWIATEEKTANAHGSNKD